MKTVALISGGKDSLLAVLMAKRYGHEPVVLANITPQPLDSEAPEDTHEIDSYMYQTVGHEVVEAIARCMGLPLRRISIAKGQSADQTLLYTDSPDPKDEVEALYRFLRDIKEEFPDVQGVTTGAILSNYQRNRVESVCQRLQLTSLAYLWQRTPEEILDMVDAVHMEAILVKTASIGLTPRKHIGQTLTAMRPTLERLKDLYGSHMAGEGGEFETIVLDCPLFATERLVVRNLRVVVVDENEYAPSGHAVLQVDCRPKTESERAADQSILADLESGNIRFPSDVMPFLPRRPMPSGGADVSNSPLFTLKESSADVVAWLQQLVTSEAESGASVQTFSVPLSSASPSAEDVMTALLRCAREEQEAQGASRVAYKYVFLFPAHLATFPEMRTVYEAVAPSVAPPLCDFFALADLSAAQLVVAYAPLALFSESDVLHCQGVSCWAAGKKGPYALARRLRAGTGSRVVMTAATPGRRPVDWELLSAANVADFAPAKASSCEAESTLAAQFAHAFANAMAYGAALGCGLSDISHVTVFIRDASTLSLLPTLWSWCTGNDLYTALSPTAILVADLGEGTPHALVSLSLQWCQE